MDISEKRVTTRHVTATVGSDELKAVLTSFVGKQVPLAAGETLVSSAAAIGSDGRVTVRLVIEGDEVEPTASLAAAPLTPAPISLTTGLELPVAG